MTLLNQFLCYGTIEVIGIIIIIIIIVVVVVVVFFLQN